MRTFWAILAAIGVALAGVWTWMYCKLIKNLSEI